MHASKCPDNNDSDLKLLLDDQNTDTQNISAMLLLHQKIN